MLRNAVCLVIATLCAASAAWSQSPGDTLSIPAGLQYEAGSFRRALHGSNWRGLWTTPVRVPVLDVRTFAGGLEPMRRGGGRQSITLHLTDAQARRWIFRSIDKFTERAVPAELHGTPAGAIIADHVSAMNPGGYFAVPVLLDAVGVLHVQPQLFIMPDDPRLGEFRDDFAGMLGELVLRPDEGPDGSPGFAGATSVKGSEAFLDDLEDSPENQLDEREFLRARLVDFLIGDSDRGTDQWRWARFGEPGAYTWRPIPVDRDWTFFRANGVIGRVASEYYPKIVRFGVKYPSITALTYSSHILDRRLLTRLTREDFEREAEFVRARITDDVIARAVAAMPPEYAAIAGAEIAATLSTRRDGIPEIAAAFYRWLATDVDVRGTDEADFVEIERRSDGTVLVRIRPRQPLLATAAAAGSLAAPAVPPATDVQYERVFKPDETREVRVYLHGGADHARITGVPIGPIFLRVIGGGGDDLLEDLAGDVRFYDDRGDNTVVRAQGTRFSDDAWSPPPAPEGLRAGTEWAPDWGRGLGYGPALDVQDRAGILLGGRASYKAYGFRRLPYHWDLDVRAFYSPSTGGASAEIDLDYRLQNSRLSLLFATVASTLETFRFHGIGNDSPDGDGTSTRFHYDQVRVAPAMVWQVGRQPGRIAPDDAGTGADDTGTREDGAEADADAGGDRWFAPSPIALRGTVSIGPVLAWTDPALPDGAVVLDAAVADAAVTQLGARAAVELSRTDGTAAPRRGFTVHAYTDAYPVVSGGNGTAFGRVGGQATAYIPLIGDGPHLALRAGSEHVFGEFPLFEAAFLGGRRSLRGHRTDRFAGDRSAFGAAELRVPLDTVKLFVRTEVGAFAFGDVGRVWYNGDSAGGWHTGYGAGAWFGVFGRAVSVAVARGGVTRFHAWLGLPF